mmetsp:Transcript_24560/g.55441  ORF Transcript_24560/g.55441 Transcript_24560/m.55441 type:complete len:91 (+) Transcript_24560:1714-1986(+)
MNASHSISRSFISQPPLPLRTFVCPDPSLPLVNTALHHHYGFCHVLRVADRMANERLGRGLADLSEPANEWAILILGKGKEVSHKSWGLL